MASCLVSLDISFAMVHHHHRNRLVRYPDPSLHMKIVTAYQNHPISEIELWQDTLIESQLLMHR